MVDTLIHERTNSGLKVELHFDHGKTSVSVRDRDFPFVKFPVDPEKALDAFNHPFAYMPRDEANKLAELQREARMIEDANEGEE